MAGIKRKNMCLMITEEDWDVLVEKAEEEQVDPSVVVRSLLRTYLSGELVLEIRDIFYGMSLDKGSGGVRN